MKGKTILFFAMCAVLFIACSGGDDDGTPGGGSSSGSITCNPSSITVDATGGTFVVETTNERGEWTAYPGNGCDSWIKVTTTNTVSKTGKITVVVSANKTNDTRTGEVVVKSGTSYKRIPVTQSIPLHVQTNSFLVRSAGENIDVKVYSSSDWSVSSSASWLTVSKKDAQTLTISAQPNNNTSTRSTSVIVTSGKETVTISIVQDSSEDQDIVVPAGYRLVWHDEFNEGTQLNSTYWEWENQPKGWVNNELQYYIKGSRDGKNTTELVDGKLNINCFKASDGNIYSARINAKNKGAGWQYGYFEARMLLPKGKGTWPAFWMMPMQVDWANEGWPKCGEIDIMEEVGCVPNVVTSSLHAEGHNHANGTQVTKERNIGTAESEYHVYALEWSAEGIKTYVDGELFLSYSSDGTIRNYPYNKPFHLILNLAWGGSWGGMNGVDESALPCTMKVDYVRVFQKN